MANAFAPPHRRDLGFSAFARLVVAGRVRPSFPFACWRGAFGAACPGAPSGPDTEGGAPPDLVVE